MLRKLFLTVFIRGQTARGITRETSPKTLASKLALTIGIYGAMGLLSLFMFGQSVLALSISLHAITFLALGMFIATSAGEALFNKDESEILLHRPVTSQMLLRAKATVLVQVSFYIALALNFFGLFVGVGTSDGGWLFPLAHIVSTVESSLFCIGLVVLMYQVCLRWLGRERVEGVMTTLQVLVMVSITIGSQILPRAIGMHKLGMVQLDAWWIKILPPAWFASLDDAIAGSRSSLSWMLAAGGVLVTCFILWLAFGKLASVYESGIQNLSESSRAAPRQNSQYRVVKAVSEMVPVRWFLKSSVSRASFQLVSAYMFRDRDTKLRLYPGLAPMMVLPIMMIITNHGSRTSPRGVELSQGFGQFFAALAATYLCLVPLSALNLLKFSQQWRAADIFIAAPLPGPSPILQGARVAVILFLSLPLVLALTVFCIITQGISSILLILVGVIALPVYTLIPGVLGNATPLSNPIEEAKSVNNMPIMMLSIFGALGLAGVATFASVEGLLLPFLAVELAASIGISILLYNVTAKSTWRLYD